MTRQDIYIGAKFEYGREWPVLKVDAAHPDVSPSEVKNWDGADLLYLSHKGARAIGESRVEPGATFNVGNQQFVVIRRADSGYGWLVMLDTPEAHRLLIWHLNYIAEVHIIGWGLFALVHTALSQQTIMEMRQFQKDWE